MISKQEIEKAIQLLTQHGCKGSILNNTLHELQKDGSTFKCYQINVQNEWGLSVCIDSPLHERILPLLKDE